MEQQRNLASRWGGIKINNSDRKQIVENFSNTGFRIEWSNLLYPNPDDPADVRTNRTELVLTTTGSSAYLPGFQG